LLFGLLFGDPFLAVLLGTAVSFVLASLYFWLLYYIRGGWLW
jgi:hypothetical protein